MKLNKENYEFLMFELLEGNLNETDKNSLLEQIKGNGFYSREWNLMQNSVCKPDMTAEYAHKQKLLKPEGNLFALMTVRPFAKIAASLLFIGLAGIWFYNYTGKKITLIEPAKKIPRTELKNKTDLNEPVVQTGQYKHPDTKTKIFKKSRILPSDYFAKTEEQNSIEPVEVITVPEIILLEPLKPQGMEYRSNITELITMVSPEVKKPDIRNAGKISQLLAGTKKLRTTTMVYINDIPNLKLKITPKMKNHKPSLDFELKGAIIYANALLEIK